MTKRKIEDKSRKEKTVVKKVKNVKTSKHSEKTVIKKALKRQNGLGDAGPEILKQKKKKSSGADTEEIIFTEPEITIAKKKAKRKMQGTDVGKKNADSSEELVEREVTVTKKRKKHANGETKISEHKMNSDQTEDMPTKKKKKVNKSETEKSETGDEDVENVNETVTESETGEGDAQKKRKKRKRSKRKKNKNKENESAQSGERRRNDAIEYVRQWKNDRDRWSFKKVLQTWLLTHYHSTEECSDEDFEMFLEYIENLKGNARDLTLEKAQTAFEDEETSEDVKERHRQVIQILS